MTRTVYRTSVRSLVEFIFRSGDIDNRISQSDALKAMQEGSRIHRRMQLSSGPSYRAEVPLSAELSFPDYDLKLDGRADGIFTEETGDVIIDEIKSTSQHPDQIEAPSRVHLAQAQCYAYLYASQNDLTAAGVQVTYVHVRPETSEKADHHPKEQEKKSEQEVIRHFRYLFSFDELKSWFDDLIDAYRKWLDYLWEWKQVRTASIKEQPFPFPYREGQKELAAGVYRTIVHGKTLFLQAPTGTGKTMAVLYPAVKAMGEGYADRLFYLTAKTVTRQAAVNAFGILQEQGLRMKYVLLTAKEKMCLCDEMVCDPDHCPYAKGHFDRINDAVYSLLQQDISFDRQTILDAAQALRVCPFELSLDLTDWTDAVICDYNYVFDPLVKLKRYFADGKSGEYLFLVDEAHNLVDRAREMYSASLIKEEFLQVRRILKPFTRRADRLLGSVNRSMLEMKKQMEEKASEKPDLLPAGRKEGTPQVLRSAGGPDLTLVRLQSVLDEILREHRDFPDREKVQDLYFKINRFLVILDLVDENYITYAQITSEGQFMLRLFCVNPAQNLQACYDSGVSTILFSATLLPVRYYMNLLSREENPYAMYAKSSFSTDQRLLLVAADVSSKYTRRSPEEFAGAAFYLKYMAEGKTGNYIAFFPSYRVLEDVCAQFEVCAADRIAEGRIRVLKQKSSMTPQERDDFLAEFAKPHDASLLAFCVMGGIFSEGIDLKEDQLIGAAVYGTGIPKVCAELSLIQEYYAQRALDGFAYAYQYPGMNKVQQAAGRVIRTASDRGVILLLDERFLRPDYRRLFPREWADYRVTDLSRVQGQIADFWRGQSNET